MAKHIHIEQGRQQQRYDKGRFLTDNGKEFVNKHLDKILIEYGIKHITTPPYHPQSDPVERTNRTLKTLIATFVDSDHINWAKNLHAFRYAINTGNDEGFPRVFKFW